MTLSIHKTWSKCIVVFLLSAFLPWGWQMSLPPAANSAPIATAPVTACSATMTLSAEEQSHARIAWQYFRNNFQPKTGLVNAVADYPSTSLWDLGNYLMALHAARSLAIIEQADFDYRLNQLLITLGKLQLFDNTLPNKTYDTQTGAIVNYANQPVDRGIGWSALDLGRFLTALDVIRNCYPQYQDWVQGIVQNWHLPTAIVNGELVGATLLKGQQRALVQEGRLGYEEYAAKGFQRWGQNADRALDREHKQKFVEIYGLQIPVDQRDYKTTNASNYVVSESYILEGLEYGLDSNMGKAAAAVLAVQKRRYEETGMLTAVSEDHIKGEPHFLYNTVYANGTPWATITETNQAYPQLRTLSTKAAFGWYYLFPDNEYAQKLVSVAKELHDPQGNGFYAGQYEATHQPNAILTTNTNALILEALLFKARNYIALTVTSDNQVAVKSTTPPKILSSTKSASKSTAKSSSSVMLGAYASDYLGSQAVIDRELNGLSQWSGKRLSIAGLFMELEDQNPAYNVPKQLTALNQNGYTAFVNFASHRTAAEIAQGKVDQALRRLAIAYASWLKQHPDRVVFLAPLPEMNGSWETYKEDPANYKRAYQRIQTFFTEAGAPRQSVRWVFAPNGWSQSTQQRFENYYPGDANVDVVAFSGYNWGYCHNATWKEWSSPQVMFEPYIKRLRSLAPTKPIFIAQTASTSQTRTGSSAAAKDEWFRQSYRYLATAPGVKAILYFNLAKECDWPLYSPNGAKSQGYKDAITDPAFNYISPLNLAQ